MNFVTATSQETDLAHSLLGSKYLVVVLGKKRKSSSVNASDFMEGAGVSQAAGIQTFRGTEGLFSQPLNKKSVLELFQKDTFEVRQPLT